MLHAIDSKKFGQFGEPMTGAVQACVHCGFCLAACPTYAELGQEMDTPRGRIVLMKRVLEGSLPWESALPHVNRCLGCLACEPACPSGVSYRELLGPFRALARSEAAPGAGEKLHRLLLGKILPFPGRFRFAVHLGKMARKVPTLAPVALRPMLELVPAYLPPKQTFPEVTPARGKRRARVALTTGCVQQVLDPDINAATIQVLSQNGVEVVIPREQGCCGGLAWHTGDLPAAQKFARRNIAAFEDEYDAILTNAAGCGSTMQEYELILRGTPEEAKAKALRKRVVDVSVFLDQLGLLPFPSKREPLRVAYQDACHLAHAQGVTAGPRRLLKAIPGLELLELSDAHFCCGSAGTYNMDQPEIAASLGQKKAKSVLATGAQLVASGNIGCLNQIRMHLTKLGSSIPVRHTMQVLRDAYECSS